MIPVALLLLAAATHVEVVDDVYQIPAGAWRYVPLGLRQKPALVSADLEVRSGSRLVRIALLQSEDLERLRDDRPYGVLAATDPAAAGRLRYQVRVPGEYVLLIDNREGATEPAEAHVRVDFDFATAFGSPEMHLSLGRQIAVITISFAVFFLIAGYSARRLLRGIRH